MSKPSKPHAIDIVHFRGADSTLECACGIFIGPDTEAGIYLGYQSHRKDLGLQLRSQSDMGITGTGITAMTVKEGR